MEQDDFNKTDYIKHELLGVFLDGLIAESMAQRRELVIIESHAGKGKRYALPMASVVNANSGHRAYNDDTPLLAARKLEAARKQGLRYQLNLHEGKLKCRKDLKTFMDNYAGLHAAEQAIQVKDTLFEEALLDYQLRRSNTDHNFAIFMDPSEEVALGYYDESMVKGIQHWLKNGRADVMLYMTQLTRRAPYVAQHDKKLDALHDSIGQRAVDFFHKMRGGAMESLDHFIITVDDKVVENRLIDTHIHAFGQLFPGKVYAANTNRTTMATSAGGYMLIP
jgi:hypothetical protein